MTDLFAPSRRGLITGLVSLIAVPAIVRASSLMAVKEVPRVMTFEDFLASPIWSDMELERFVLQSEMLRNATLYGIGISCDGINRDPQSFWNPCA